jgi:8-oxo-dGTP pyrophosphatase MutT (NUDIX family)
MRAMPDRWKPNVTVAAIIERDPAESPITACVREVDEETAHDFVPTALVGIYLNRFVRTRTGSDITYLRFAFTGELGDFRAGQPLDEGIIRTVWMTLDELKACAAQHRSPLVMQSIEDYLAGRRYPLELIHTDPSVLQAPQPH